MRWAHEKREGKGLTRTNTDSRGGGGLDAGGGIKVLPGYNPTAPAMLWRLTAQGAKTASVMP